MDLNKILIGSNSPEEVNVIIEVPSESSPIKYEFDKESGAIFVDRILKTPMHYPANYGFIPHTLADDGDPLDALVITRHALIPMCVVPSRPVGVLIMEDEKGKDEKIICVPTKSVEGYYSYIKDLNDLPGALLDSISFFFSQYKGLDVGKWAKVDGFRDAEFAKNLIKKFALK